MPLRSVEAERREALPSMLEKNSVHTCDETTRVGGSAKGNPNRRSERRRAVRIMPKRAPIADPVAEAKRLLADRHWSGHDEDQARFTLEALITLVEKLEKQLPDWHQQNDVW